ncbi:MAG: ThuA domain-containing protein, partial [Chryseolinea sp.]
MFRFNILTCIILCFYFSISAQSNPPNFKVVAFYTAKNDAAHISFVHEAHKWFSTLATQNHFAYDSTNNWDNLNKEYLSQYQVVLFLDTRPEAPKQREAFQYYMEHGGAWMGFHFAGFALNDSDFNQDWDWYHNTFIGAGQYVSNTWRPTSAMLRVEDPKHPVTNHLPITFKSSPNEWYRWE